MQIVLTDTVSLQNAVKNLDDRLCRAICLNDRVALIPAHAELIFHPGDLTYKVMLQSVIGFLNDVRIVGITQAVPELLRLDRFQLLLEPCELILKADGGVFCFGEQCFFLGDGFL